MDWLANFACLHLGPTWGSAQLSSPPDQQQMREPHKEETMKILHAISASARLAKVLQNSVPCSPTLDSNLPHAVGANPPPLLCTFSAQHMAPMLSHSEHTPSKTPTPLTATSLGNALPVAPTMHQAIPLRGLRAPQPPTVFQIQDL